MEIRRKIRHYLIDIVYPDEQFTAGDFYKKALQARDEIVQKDKLPFFVGGTGLYINSLFEGIADIPLIGKDVKNGLLEELGEYGLGYLYQELCTIDKNFAEKIHSNDRQRILRALEVYRSTGKPIQSFYKTNKGYESDKTLYIGLYDERDKLRANIDSRVDLMIKKGFTEEVQHIRSLGYGPELNSMKSIGYKEINMYLDGKIEFPEALESIKTGTKKYAKRQLTWFRKNKNIHWFTPVETDKIAVLVEKWLNN